MACSPSVAEYIASTSAAVLLTASKLTFWNSANNLRASSNLSEVSRNSVKRSLQKHLRYVSLAFAHIWSIHVAYASRQLEYPPPIFETSLNTAVARAEPARETFAPPVFAFTAERTADGFDAVLAAFVPLTTGRTERTVAPRTAAGRAVTTGRD